MKSFKQGIFSEKFLEDAPIELLLEHAATNIQDIPDPVQPKRQYKVYLRGNQVLGDFDDLRPVKGNIFKLEAGVSKGDLIRYLRNDGSIQKVCQEWKEIKEQI